MKPAGDDDENEVSSTSAPGGVSFPADSGTDAGGDAEPHSTTNGENYQCPDEGGGEGEEYPPVGYEYLDHTADVQIHAWGTDLAEAFQQAALAMFGYMTELETVEPADTQEITAEGHDIESLLFHFLDEFLFLFSADPFFVACDVQILEFDRQNFRIRARGYGETFDLSKHPQGTEVKAITYSNMQVYDNDNQHEVFVIIDI